MMIHHRSTQNLIMNRLWKSVVNLNNLFQSKRNSFVEIQNLGTEQIVIFCLKHIRNGFHPIGTCLIVFSSVGFTIGIFSLIRRKEASEASVAVLLLCICFRQLLHYSMLAVFLWKEPFCFLPTSMIKQCADACVLYFISCVKTVEQRNAEWELQVFIKILMPLAAEWSIFYSWDIIVVCSYTCTEV